MTLETNPNRLIKIGGITYKIIYIDTPCSEDMGRTEVVSSTICIYTRNVSKQKQEQTLVHEILHAMLHEAGLDDEVNNESLVAPLANMMYQVLKSNEYMIKEIW